MSQIPIGNRPGADPSEAREPTSATGSDRQPARADGGWGSILVAGVIGLVCSIIIWVAAPYNNFVLGSSFIADDYLPVSVVFLLLVIVLGINPLLRWIRRGLALTTAQLAIILAIMLMACVIPGQGTLRMLPYMIGKVPIDVSTDPHLAEQYGKMDLSPKLFPDKVALGAKTPVSDNFIRDLPSGETVPWKAWLWPLCVWGLFMLAAWMMMIGLGMIVLPQWRHNERLAFPLLAVEKAVIESPQNGGWLAPLFRRRWFWVAASGVFVLHALKGLNTYYPESVPAVPMQWNLTDLLATEPWRAIPGHIRKNQIYFIFVGVAFFMPNRISFSIWFTIFAYGFYRMFGMAYFPPFHHYTMYDHRTGAMLAVTVGVLWIGRAHWARVFGSMFRRARDSLDRYHRKSGWLFLLGCTGFLAWLLWVGVPLVWSLLLLAFAFMVMLLVGRIVAETGMPFWRIHTDSLYLMKLLPVSWLAPITLFFSQAVTMLIAAGSRVSPTVMVTHGLALDDNASSKRQWRLGLVLLAVLLIGLVFCGAVHLDISYHHAGTIDAREQPLSAWGTGGFKRAHDAMLELSRGQLGRPDHNVPAHIAFGAGLGALLYWLCMTFPTWPLHPVGLILVGTSSYGEKAWASIFFGWLLKVLLVRFGGAAVYRAARPVFLGVIMGEVVAAIAWAAVPPILAASGVAYKAVDILPG